MIYFFRDESAGLIKIGVAADPEKRLAGLQVGNPRPLMLMGVLPGGVAEERLLHRQFADSRVRGEWFRLGLEGRVAIGLLLARQGRPATVADELRRRGDCRYGMSGLAALVLGSEGVYRVRATRWDAGSELVLDLCPDGDPGPRDLWCESTDEQVCQERAIRVYSAADWRGTYWPAGAIRGALAADCILLEPWPHACCEPT